MAFLAGQKIRASDLNFIVPGFVRKPSDQSIASNATLQNDTALVLPVLANASYAVECAIICDGGTVGDAKFAFSWPASATMPWSMISYITTGTQVSSGNTPFLGSFASPTSGSSAFGAGLCGAGNQGFVLLKGNLTTTSTAGNVQLMWSQLASDGTAATVRTGSTMRVDRVS